MFPQHQQYKWTFSQEKEYCHCHFSVKSNHNHSSRDPMTAVIEIKRTPGLKSSFAVLLVAFEIGIKEEFEDATPGEASAKMMPHVYI